MQMIHIYLPDMGDYWYNYQTKVREVTVGLWQTRTLTDLQQGIFVRGGAVLTLLRHDNCMALLACFQNDLTLEIYLDS